MLTTKDVVIQTAVSGQLAAALKAHAAIRQVLLFDVFVEAMEQFVGLLSSADASPTSRTCSEPGKIGERRYESRREVLVE